MLRTAHRTFTSKNASLARFASSINKANASEADYIGIFCVLLYFSLNMHVFCDKIVGQSSHVLKILYAFKI